MLIYNGKVRVKKFRDKIIILNTKNKIIFPVLMKPHSYLLFLRKAKTFHI